MVSSSAKKLAISANSGIARTREPTRSRKAWPSAPTEVAERIAAIRPGLPALFISGYAQPILDFHGVPEARYDILDKPWTEASLLSRVRQALGRTAAPQSRKLPT